MNATESDHLTLVSMHRLLELLKAERGLMRFLNEGEEEFFGAIKTLGHGSARIYLQWLLQRAEARGAEREQAKIEKLEERLARIRQTARDYKKDPVNAFDRPSSWQKLDNLLNAAEEIL